jgi:hypothetical protein
MRSTATAEPLDMLEQHLEAGNENSPGMESMSRGKRDKFGNCARRPVPSHQHPPNTKQERERERKHEEKRSRNKTKEEGTSKNETERRVNTHLYVGVVNVTLYIFH